MNFKEYKSQNYADIADEILSFWKQNNIFEKSIEVREGSPTFTFYEGPPSANGTPGIHHVMARTIKDIFCRYKTLQGFQVHRKGGWDTHGLPIELQVEKELGITKDDIGKKISVEDYNKKCREAVMRFTDLWQDMTDKMGYWVDMNDPYITYKNEYIESVWYLLKEFYKKGLLYKGYTIQPYSPAAGTGLSSHELNQPGCYRDVKDTSIVAQFKAKYSSKSKFLFESETEDVRFLAWTTTPWTLPGNCGLTVGEKIDYVKIKTFNPYTFEPISVILAKALMGKYFSEKAKDIALTDYKAGDKLIPFELVAEFKGKDLLELRYEQLIPAVANHNLDTNAFRVIAGDFVTTEDGTGIVHTASLFGADDFRVCQQNGVPSVMVQDENGKDVPVVDRKGKFVNEVGEWLVEKVAEFGVKTHREIPADGFFVKNYLSEDEKQDNYKNTDEIISIILKQQNLAFKVERYEHSYPHCWRTDKPVLYYPLDSWFIRTTAMKDKLVELNKTINWAPESTGTGRFGNWLENLVDWNLSRSRYWGTPLPIWKTALEVKNDNNEDVLNKVVGSIEDLRDSRFKYLSNVNLERMVLEAKRIVDKNIVSEDKMSFDFERERSSEDRLITDLRSWRDLKYSLDNLRDFCFYNAGNEFVEFLLKYTESTSVYLDNPDFDLHRPYIDNIFYVDEFNNAIQNLSKNLEAPVNINDERVVRNSNQTDRKYLVFTRETDLIDVWFDSGAMPYAQLHYPFSPLSAGEGKGVRSFPADFISEGVDQTRGWFFTLHAIAGMLFDSVAFKNVVSTGLVLDKNGNKMSKRLGNGIDPFETMAKYGPDPTRWYMITNAEPWDNLKFNLEGIAEVQRKFFGTLFNTYNFFALYANLDGYKVEQFNRVPKESLTELDRWIVSKVYTLAKEVAEEFNNYNPTKAGRLIQDFVCDDLSNWYVRLNRRRFWQGELTDDKRAAYETLQHCLVAVAQFMSPIAPFFGDWLYRNMTEHVREESVERNTPFKVESVHFSTWHTYDATWVDKDLEQSMALAQKVCSLVHSLRKNNKIKVRQPLSKVLIPVLNEETRRQIEHVAYIIESEVNVKAVEFITDDSSAGILKKKVKPNFKALGPKFGKDMKVVADAITAMDADAIKVLETTNEFVVPDSSFVITKADVEIQTEDVPGWLVASEGGVTVALDINITDELRKEGIARDFVNRVQNQRKDNGYEVTDKIAIQLQNNNEELKTAVETFKDYICKEVQAVSLIIGEDRPAEATEIEMDEFMLIVGLKTV